MGKFFAAVWSQEGTSSIPGRWKITVAHRLMAGHMTHTVMADRARTAAKGHSWGRLSRPEVQFQITFEVFARVQQLPGIAEQHGERLSTGWDLSLDPLVQVGTGQNTGAPGKLSFCRPKRGKR